MSKTRLLFVSILAVFAVTAVVSASASAAVAKFSATATISKTTKVTKNFVLSAEGQPTIECTKVEPNGGAVTGGTSEGKVTSINFTGCTDTSSPTKCSVVEPIVVKESTITLEGEKTATSGKFAPKVGTEFTTLELKNKGEEACAAKGKFKVTGTAKTVTKNDSESKTKHTLEFNVSNGELKYAEKAAKFTGAGEFEFSVAEAWS